MSAGAGHLGDTAAAENLLEGLDPAGSVAWTRLLEQIDWYDRGSRRNQRWFKRLKMAQIILAAGIPVAAAASAPSVVVAVAGALIVVLESVQQLQQYQQNWTQYRATCERLKHERFLFATLAGPYGRAPRPAGLLAERTEGLVSQEQAAWTSHQDEARRAGEPT